MITSYTGSNNNAIMNRIHDQYAESFVIFQVYNATVVAPAMKVIRDCHEKPRGCPTHSAVELTRRDPLPVGILEDGTVGTHYRFKEANVKNGYGNRC